MSDKKPQVKLENLSGNIFAVQGAAVEALRKAGQRDKIKEMRERVTSSGSYDNALCVIMEYVDFSDGDDDDIDDSQLRASRLTSPPEDEEYDVEECDGTDA